MAKMSGGQDKFSQVVYGTVTESAANTLTFQKLETGYGSLEKVGWVIQMIEWYPNLAWLVENIATDDVAQAGLCLSNLITSLDLSSAAVVDMLELRCALITGVGKQDHLLPVRRDFTALEGGGILVLPYPLYIAVKCTSHANPATVACRIHFKQVPLTDSDWVELVEARRLLT